MYFSLIFSLIAAPSHIVTVMYAFYHVLKKKKKNNMAVSNKNTNPKDGRKKTMRI